MAGAPLPPPTPWTALVKVRLTPPRPRCSPGLLQVTLLLFSHTSYFGNPATEFASKPTRDCLKTHQGIMFIFNLLCILPLHLSRRSPYLVIKAPHLRQPCTTKVWFAPPHSGVFAQNPKGVGSSPVCWPHILEEWSCGTATQPLFYFLDTQLSAKLSKSVGFCVSKSIFSKMQR